MIRVAFVASWGSPDALLYEYKIYTPNCNGVWGRIRGVAQLKDADIYIVMDRGPPAVVARLPKERCVFFQREPSAVQKWLRPRGAKQIVTHADMLHIATPWIKKSYTFLKSFPHKQRKRPLVAIVGGGYTLPAHRQRIDLISHLTKVLPKGCIDVFGRNLLKFKMHGCYRGPIRSKCKFDVLTQYQYCLAFENCAEINYVSEKLYDCFMSLTFPIYWGAPNVTTYFSTTAMHILPKLDTIAAATTQISQYIKQPPNKTQRDALQAARQKTMNDYNIWPRIESVLTTATQI